MTTPVNGWRRKSDAAGQVWLEKSIPGKPGAVQRVYEVALSQYGSVNHTSYERTTGPLVAVGAKPETTTATEAKPDWFLGSESEWRTRQATRPFGAANRCSLFG